MTRQHKFFSGKNLAIDPERRSVTVIMSDDTPDRDGDVIDQKGWDLEEFRKNPVFLWSHNPHEPPVGRVENIRVEGNALKGDVIFPEEGKAPFSDMIFEMYKCGALSAVSVGFEPVESTDRIENGAVVGQRFTRQKLFELSAVSIPANSNAVVDRKSKIEFVESELLSDLPRVERSQLVAVYKSLGRSHLTVPAERADELRRKNLAAIAAQRKSAEEEEDDDEIWETTSAGETPHTHRIVAGDTLTDEVEGHQHSVSYDADGTPTLSEEAGHTHEMPPEARGAADDEVVTPPSEPEKSAYALFPPAEARGLFKNFPGLAVGGHDLELIEGIAAGRAWALRSREDWLAENQYSPSASALDFAVRCGIHPKGLDWMRRSIAEQTVDAISAESVELTDAEITEIVTETVAATVNAALGRL